ncbi:MAG: VRR-NUC domain-containing protein [Acidithiobacillus sp.]|uniref:VRR-NUC domain-containing protein n=1 Tax=Acidithiobacillus sp. TaxID=1872118 RepID=UPI003CFC6357
MREVDLMDRIRSLGTGDLRLFRNNVGLAYTRAGSPVRFGLANGSPDLIGWKRVTITPDMIGQTIAVAVGIEVKTATGRIREDQERFLAHMQDFGALAGVARSIEEARTICGL